MHDYQAHVRKVEKNRETYCGKDNGSIAWMFVDENHARNAIEQNTRMQPCADCWREIQAMHTKTTYPIGTVINCNRCDKRFELTRERKGTRLHTTAARLQEFETCPHCQQRDTHWVYARNNLERQELLWEIALLEFTFATVEQAQYAQNYLSARNVFLIGHNMSARLVAQNNGDAIAAIELLHARAEKLNALCAV